MEELIKKCTGYQDLSELFSTRLDLESGSMPPANGSVLSTPIMLAHSTDDEVIDVELGRKARNTLCSLGMSVVWREEEKGGHLCMLQSRGLDHVAAFLQETVDAKS